MLDLTRGSEVLEGGETRTGPDFVKTNLSAALALVLLVATVPALADSAETYNEKLIWVVKNTYKMDRSTDERLAAYRKSGSLRDALRDGCDEAARGVVDAHSAVATANQEISFYEQQRAKELERVDDPDRRERIEQDRQRNIDNVNETRLRPSEKSLREASADWEPISGPCMSKIDELESLVRAHLLTDEEREARRKRAALEALQRQ